MRPNPTLCTEARRLPYALELMKLTIALMLLSVLGNSEAQPLPLETQLPDWATPKWERIAKEASLKLSGRLNPFLQRGDFDGDGTADLALFVESTKSGKYGITVIYAGNRSPRVLFAGKPLGKRRIIAPRQNLQGDEAIQPRLPGLVHRPHAALAEQLDDLQLRKQRPQLID